MILEISTTYRPATDLGYLLHKNPARVHSFELTFGKAHVFYPVATAELCTAALVLDIDPVGLVRRPTGASGPAREYVNDRPYVASSFLSVTLSRVFGLPPGAFRHADHRFEGTREEFQAWSRTVGERFGYGVRFLPVGLEAGDVGAPTQMVIFTRG